MTTAIIILLVLPFPVGLLFLWRSLSDFNNWIVVLTVPFAAVCWFGAFCLWLGGKLV